MSNVFFCNVGLSRPPSTKTPREAQLLRRKTQSSIDSIPLRTNLQIAKAFIPPPAEPDIHGWNASGGVALEASAAEFVRATESGRFGRARKTPAIFFALHFLAIILRSTDVRRSVERRPLSEKPEFIFISWLVFPLAEQRRATLSGRKRSTQRGIQTPGKKLNSRVDRQATVCFSLKTKGLPARVGREYLSGRHRL